MRYLLPILQTATCPELPCFVGAREHWLGKRRAQPISDREARTLRTHKRGLALIAAHDFTPITNHQIYNGESIFYGTIEDVPPGFSLVEKNAILQSFDKVWARSRPFSARLVCTQPQFLYRRAPGFRRVSSPFARMACSIRLLFPSLLHPFPLMHRMSLSAEARDANNAQLSNSNTELPTP